MKTKNLNDNINDLPKWAQSEISILQMRLREAKDEIKRMKDNPESNTLVGSAYTMRDEVKQYLKENQDITFILDKGCYLSARIKHGVLEISSQGRKDFYIRPQVSNSIQIHLKD